MTLDLKLKAAYLTWSKDNSLQKLFENSGQKILSFPADNRVLAEAFLHVPEKEEKDLLSNPDDKNLNFGKQLTISQVKNTRSLPFVKIIYSACEHVKVGEIYSVKDSLANIEHNPEYTNWWSRRAQQPSLEGKEPTPSMYRMGWDNWVTFKYIIDKFKLVSEREINEEMVFLIPEIVLITKSNLNFDNETILSDSNG